MNECDKRKKEKKKITQSLSVLTDEVFIIDPKRSSAKMLYVSVNTDALQVYLDALLVHNRITNNKDENPISSQIKLLRVALSNAWILWHSKRAVFSFCRDQVSVVIAGLRKIISYPTEQHRLY